MAERASLFEVQHWIVTRASGLEGGFLIDGIDRLMTLNFAIDKLGTQLLQLRWNASSEVVRLVPNERGFVVDNVVPDADDVSATCAPRGVDARSSDVFGLLDPGTMILVSMDGAQASIILEQANTDDVSLELTAWNVPFASRTALIVCDLCLFQPIDTDHAQGLETVAFPRDGASHKILVTRFRRGGREYFEVEWNSEGFEVVGPFESTGQWGHWPDEEPPVPEFPGRPIASGDSFAVVLGHDHTLELRNITQGWSYLLTPFGRGR